MFSNIKYPTLGATPNDWVEMPSQFNEHWALEPKVLEHYARHYETGKPIPPALVERVRKTTDVQRGVRDDRVPRGGAPRPRLAHASRRRAARPDVDAFEKAALARFHVDLSQVPPRYRTTYFAHVWEGGYSAGYYAYLWSEVLDDDAYYWFKEHGGMTRANGQRFRDMILSREGTADVADLYRAFRGRDPIVQPLLQERGLATEPPAKTPP